MFTSFPLFPPIPCKEKYCNRAHFPFPRHELVSLTKVISGPTSAQRKNEKFPIV